MNNEPLPDENDEAFVVDMTRYTEGVLTEQDIRTRYRLNAAGWETLATNEKLFEAIAECRLRRRHRGDKKRERAQIHVEGAPDVLGGIMRDDTAPPRSRNEAIKTLNALATEGQQNTGSPEIFEITINLGGDSLHYCMPLKPVTPGDNAKPVAAIAPPKVAEDDAEPL